MSNINEQAYKEMIQVASVGQWTLGEWPVGTFFTRVEVREESFLSHSHPRNYSLEDVPASCWTNSRPLILAVRLWFLPLQFACEAKKTLWMTWTVGLRSFFSFLFILLLLFTWGPRGNGLSSLTVFLLSSSCSPLTFWCNWNKLQVNGMREQLERREFFSDFFL